MQGNSALYIVGGLGVAWYLGIFDGLLGAGMVEAPPPIGADQASNIIDNSAPKTAAGQRSLVTARSTSTVDSASALRKRIAVTGGGANSSLYPTSAAPPSVSAPVPVATAPTGCYMVASPFGPRTVCSS